MSSSDQKLDEILQSLNRIEKALDIVPDREITLTDFESSVYSYEEFARDELSLGQSTIDNQRSVILRFLDHSRGIVNKDTVKEYLASNDSSSWKSNQLKALRKYLRDFLKLGNWINDFDFSKTKAKIKNIPSDQEISQFVEFLDTPFNLIFLMLYNSGLRIGEMMGIKVRDIDFATNMINVSNIHEGYTKSAWISFFTKQTASYLEQYIQYHSLSDDSRLFAMSERSVQNAFKEASEILEIAINPHLLRTVFAEKCTTAGIADKHIDAFCGRIPQGVLAKHYTDYSPSKLREVYDKLEPHFTL